MENTKVITRIWKIIHEALEEIKGNEAYSLALYGLLIELLPMTTLNDKRVIKNRKVMISGLTQLAYNWEFKRLNVKEQDQRLIYFNFYLGDKATVKSGWRNQKLIFAGNWLETLEFIVTEIKDSNLNAKLTRSQQIIFEDFILALAEK